MAYKTIITDGTKAYDAPMNDPAAWVIKGQDDAETVDLKTRVGVVFRARELLSNAIANLPFALVDMSTGEDVDNSGDWQNVVGFLPDPFDLLRRWRLSLMDTNAAYAFREGTSQKTTGLRYLVPSTITPLTDKNDGHLIGFDRDIGKGKQTYTLKDNRIVYIWRLDETTELLPSAHTELKAISAAAGIMYYADLWTSNYFQRGGVKPTLIAVKGVTGNTVRDEMESRFTKFVRNISRQAAQVFNAETMTISPFGDGVGDLKDSEVYNQAMQSVCAVTGIPISIFMSDAANRATADTYYYSWYKDKITPDARMIQFQLNERLFHPLGIKLEFRPEQAEPNQEEEVARAQALQTYVSAGYSLGMASEIMGVDLPEGVDYDDLDEMQAEKEAKQKEEEQARLDAAMAKQEQNAQDAPAKFVPSLDQLREMERWQVFAFRKLKKGESMDFPFELRDLPASVGAEVRKRLLTARTEAEIKAAFAAVTETPAPAYAEPDYSYLLDGIKAGLDALKLQPVAQPVNVTVHNHPDAAPVVNVPETKAVDAPVVNVQVNPTPVTVENTVNVPEQAAPTVNVTNDVAPAGVTVVQQAKPRKVKIKKDSQGGYTMEPEV